MATSIITNIADHAIKTISTILVLGNESLLIQNAWIISPSPGLKDKHKRRNITDGIHPLITATIYAILEPLFTTFVLWLAIAPVFVVLTFGQFRIHCTHAFLEPIPPPEAEDTGATEDESPLQDGASDEKRVVHPSDTAFEAAERGSPPPPNTRTIPGKEDRVPLWSAVLFPVLSAALSNAAFLLFAQSLYSLTSWNSIPWLVTILNTLALAIYLGIQFVDRNVCLFSGRALYLGAQGFEVAKTQGLCLVVMGLVKFVTRKVLGLDGLVGWGFREVRAEELFGEERYKWFDGSWLTRLPWWVSPICHVVTIASGVYFARRARR